MSRVLQACISRIPWYLPSPHHMYLQTHQQRWRKSRTLLSRIHQTRGQVRHQKKVSGLSLYPTNSKCTVYSLFTYLLVSPPTNQTGLFMYWFVCLSAQLHVNHVYKLYIIVLQTRERYLYSVQIYFCHSFH